MKSQDSWLIQLVDCIAYIRNRYEKNGTRHDWDETRYNQSEKAVATLWEQYCHPCVINSRIWPT